MVLSPRPCPKTLWEKEKGAKKECQQGEETGELYESGQLKGGREEKGLGVEACLPSCCPLAHWLLSTYFVQHTVGASLEETMMGQPQPSLSEGDLLVNP